MRSKPIVRKLRPLHVGVGAAVLTVPGSAVALAAGQSAAQSTPSGGASAITASPPHSLTANAHFDLHARTINALGAQSVQVRGRLLPGVGGREVTLLGRSAGSWRSLARARVGSRGSFDLRFDAGSGSQQRLRVSFAGDRFSAGASAPAGRLTVFHQSLASWYDDGGGTACGFHAHYGVANRDLPCGTKVTFAYGGRTVQAVVDDRGPFVGGRDWDLNQNTAGALGFSGVDTVWTSF